MHCRLSPAVTKQRSCLTLIQRKYPTDNFRSNRFKIKMNHHARTVPISVIKRDSFFSVIYSTRQWTRKCGSEEVNLDEYQFERSNSMISSTRLITEMRGCVTQKPAKSNQDQSKRNQREITSSRTHKTSSEKNTWDLHSGKHTRNTKRQTTPTILFHYLLSIQSLPSCLHRLPLFPTSGLR